MRVVLNQFCVLRFAWFLKALLKIRLLFSSSSGRISETWHFKFCAKICVQLRLGLDQFFLRFALVLRSCCNLVWIWFSPPAPGRTTEIGHLNSVQKLRLAVHLGSFSQYIQGISRTDTILGQFEDIFCDLCAAIFCRFKSVEIGFFLILFLFFCFLKSDLLQLRSEFSRVMQLYREIRRIEDEWQAVLNAYIDSTELIRSRVLCGSLAGKRPVDVRFQFWRIEHFVTPPEEGV